MATIEMNSVDGGIGAIARLVTESPRAVTARTRPPAETTRHLVVSSPRERLKTSGNSSHRSKPLIGFPLSYFPGYPPDAIMTVTATRSSNSIVAFLIFPSIVAIKAGNRSDFIRGKIACVSGSPKRQLNSSTRKPSPRNHQSWKKKTAKVRTVSR